MRVRFGLRPGRVLVVAVVLVAVAVADERWLLAVAWALLAVAEWVTFKQGRRHV